MSSNNTVEEEIFDHETGTTWCVELTENDGQVEAKITSGGIVQDIIPSHVFTRALKLWNVWMQQC